MSTDEDTELRDLVSQTLETSGVLGKIRAQLRASVFLALEEENAKENKIPLANEELKDFLNSRNGTLAANLVREFLDYFNLEFTQAVFDPETSLNIHYKYDGRSPLCREFTMDRSERGPVLGELVRRSFSTTGNNVAKDLTVEQIASAEMKFDIIDKHKKGVLDKERICDLMMEIFPHFRRSLLEVFVNEEFQKQNKNFGQGINFDEFLLLYRHFYGLCHGVIIHTPIAFTPSTITDKSNQFTDILATNDVNDNKHNNFTLEQSMLSKMAISTPANKENSISTDAESPQSGNDNSEMDSFFDDRLPADPANPLYLGGRETRQEGSEFGSSIFGEDSPKSIGDNKTLNKLLEPSAFSMVTTRDKGLGSLKDVPPLAPPSKGADQSPLWNDFNKQLSDYELGRHHHDNDYEEDFQSSLSARSDLKSGTENSIEEEIEADVSGAVDDLLNSSISGAEDLTIDKSVSQISGKNVDYLQNASW